MNLLSNLSHLGAGVWLGEEQERWEEAGGNPMECRPPFYTGLGGQLIKQGWKEPRGLGGREQPPPPAHTLGSGLLRFPSCLCNQWPSRHDSLNGETVKPPQKDGFVSVLFFYGRALVILIN